MEIRQVLKYAHAGRQFETAPVSLALAPSRQGLLVSLDGAPLGLLRSESAAAVHRQYGAQLLRGQPLTLTAALTSAPSNAALLRADPTSLRTPWQIEARHLGEERESGRARELVREGLREQYVAYVARAYEMNPHLSLGFELDVEVAQAAQADGRSFREIAALLSTSDTLIRVRPEPGSPAWYSYEGQAKRYVLDVLRASDAGNGERSPLSPAEPHLHDTYRSYAERVRRANPYVEGGVELDRQVADLARADGRSREEEEAILRASREVLVR